MRNTLRFELPRLGDLHPGSAVRYAVTDGRVLTRSGELPLERLALDLPALPPVAILHPADVVLAHTALPPLPPHRMAEAIPAAAEPLTLADPDTLAIAGGPRDAQGMATLAWTARARLAQAWQTLADAGLPAERLVPAPLALPNPGAAGLTFMLREHHLLARHGDHRGHALALNELRSEDEADPAVLAWMRLLLQQAAPASLLWIGYCPSWAREAADPIPIRTVPAAERWQADLPNWSLALPALRPHRMQRSAWRRPLAWSAAATAVWLVGLNLYAAQLAREEAVLKQHMTRQVQATFPALPVVLDPLRQATQQRDALLTATGSMAESDLLPLAQAVAQLLPASANNVASLQFDQGMLALTLIDNTAAPAGALDPELAKRAHDLGLQVDRRDGRWLIRRQDADDGENGFAIRPGASVAASAQQAGGLR